MRPLDKGPTPVDAVGNPIAVTDYKDWRLQLINRIGYYCVYCNIPLSHSLEVEHVVPKNPPAGILHGSLLDWDNMLLACGPCNNAKGNKRVNLNRLYLPESNNTLLAFHHEQHPAHPDNVVVTAANGLTSIQSVKANATIELMKLDNVDLRGRVVDIRSRKRKDALIMAQESYKLYQKTKIDNPAEINDLANFLALVAKGYGFFGSWFRIFKNEPEMIRALLDPNIIPGTALNCFDPATEFSLLNRNPGNAADPI